MCKKEINYVDTNAKDDVEVLRVSKYFIVNFNDELQDIQKEGWILDPDWQDMYPNSKFTRFYRYEPVSVTTIAERDLTISNNSQWQDSNTRMFIVDNREDLERWQDEGWTFDMGYLEFNKDEKTVTDFKLFHFYRRSANKLPIPQPMQNS